MRTLPGRRVLMTLPLLAAAGLATAQESERQPLSGPSVEQDRPASLDERFGEMQPGTTRMGRIEAIPPQDLRKIIAGMSRDAGDEAIRLSPEQTREIRTITREHEAERRAWMREHREEIAKLYSEAGLPMPNLRSPVAGGRDQQSVAPGRGLGGPDVEGDAPERRQREQTRGNERDRSRQGERRGAPESEERDMRQRLTPEDARRAPGRRMPTTGRAGSDGEGRPAQSDRVTPEATPEQQAARERLRAYMAKGPSTGDLQRRIYAVLSEEQRTHFDTEVERLLEERSNAVMRERLENQRRDRAQIRARLSEIDWDKVLPEDGSVNLEALPGMLRERMDRVEPERRRAILERLRDRMHRAPGDL